MVEADDSFCRLVFVVLMLCLSFVLSHSEETSLSPTPANDLAYRGRDLFLDFFVPVFLCFIRAVSDCVSKYQPHDERENLPLDCEKIWSGKRYTHTTFLGTKVCHEPLKRHAC